MKGKSCRECRGNLIEDIVKAVIYAVVLAAHDLYGWKGAAEKLGFATAEIISGYAEEAQHGEMADALKREAESRGFKITIEMKRGK